MKKIKIKIQKSKCIGSGQCVINSPKFFSQSDEDGIVELVKSEAEIKFFEELCNTEELCPAGVIELKIT